MLGGGEHTILMVETGFEICSFEVLVERFVRRE